MKKSDLKHVPQSDRVATTGHSQARATFVRDMIIITAAIVLLQVFIGYIGSIRACRYYARIFYLIEINVMLTVSLSLINGLTGQFSLGHAGFMAIGAYASVTCTTLIPKILHGAPVGVGDIQGHLVFLVSIIIAAVLSGLFGFIIGFPSLRLRGDYLAIVTLAAGEVIRALLRFFDFTGGPRGVPGIPKFTNVVYVGLAAIGTIWLMRNFVYSHYGRMCIAVRDNEIAAKCMGIHTTHVKVMAFVLGACFAGVAGGLFAHMSQYINPDNFNVLKSFDILIFLYIGGARTLSGGIVGAALFTMVPEVLRFGHLESWRMVVYPLILILVMRFRPDGIMGEREFRVLVPWKYMEWRLGGR